MQVIEELDVEVDRRITEILLSKLSFFLEEDSYVGVISNTRLKIAYASIIEAYTKFKRIYNKLTKRGDERANNAYKQYMIYNARKEDYRELLTQRGIDYKEVQKNLHRYHYGPYPLN